MTSEPDPTLDDAPPASASAADAETTQKAQPPRPPFDQRTQLACGSGFAVAVVALLGS